MIFFYSLAGVTFASVCIFGCAAVAWYAWEDAKAYAFCMVLLSLTALFFSIGVALEILSRHA